jgi:outer membrane PBP1 activator LpoA protein
LFSDEGFLKSAEKYVLFCHITSQVKTDPYQTLRNEKGGTVYPYLAFLDFDGTLLASLSWPPSLKKIESAAAQVASYYETRKKADSGDKAAKFDLLMFEVEFGKIKFEDAQAQVKDMGELTKEQQARMLDAEVISIVKPIKHNDKTALRQAGKKFLEMKTQGRIPVGDKALQAFWICIMDYAEAEKDAALFEEALNALKEKHGNNPDAKPFFEKKEEALRKLKEG